jgi:hypothetical protein
MLGVSRYLESKESPSGPKTELGASRFYDSKRSPSGPTIKRGASRFYDSKKAQAVRDKAWGESFS